MRTIARFGHEANICREFVKYARRENDGQLINNLLPSIRCGEKKSKHPGLALTHLKMSLTKSAGQTRTCGDEVTLCIDTPE